MLFENSIHFGRGIGWTLDRQDEPDLIVAQALRLNQVKNVLGPIPLGGGEEDRIAPLYRLNPSLAAEIEERFFVGFEARSDQRDGLVSGRRNLLRGRLERVLIALYSRP